MLKRFVGIDPGMYGAIAAWEGDLSETGVKGEWSLYQMPILEYKKGRFDLDLDAICKHLLIISNNQCPGPVGYLDMVAVEEPPYIPLNGGFAIRSLFKSYGELRGILSMIQVHEGLQGVIYPGPKVWKAQVLPGKSKDKEAAIAYVRTTYPKLDLPMHPKHPKKFHDGIADAICLADYARTQYYFKFGIN